MIPEKIATGAAVPGAGGPIPAVPLEGPGGQGLFAWYAPGFSDKLGDRLLLFDNTDGRPLELLRLRADFARSPGFESALRDRARELADFDDPHYARVCRVDRLPDPGGGLAVVSEQVEGQRLSDVLALVRQRRARLGADLAMTLVADLASGLAALHARGPQVAHGLLAPERLVLTPTGRVLITEYVLGLAFRSLPPTRDVAALTLPGGLMVPGGPAPCDQRADVVQLGLVALSLLLARPLAADDYPSRLDDLLAEAEDRARLGGWELAQWRGVRAWLDRLLQPASPAAIGEGMEAKRSLDEVLHGSGARLAPTSECARLLDDGGNRVTRPEVVEAAASMPPPDETTTTSQAAEDLLAFPAEREVDRQAGAARRRAGRDGARERWRPRQAIGRPRPVIVALLALAVLLEGAYIASRVLGGRRAPPTTQGVLSVESNPGRATVTLDGKVVGPTPVRLNLAPGSHTLDLALGTRRRTVKLNVEAGANLAQYVELPSETPATGQINVRTEPAGARVTVDGVPQGVAPLVVTGLSLGEHQVRLDLRGRSVVQVVTVEGTEAAALFVPFGGGDAPTAGWLAIAAPVEVQVFEDGALLGTSKSERIMLPSGTHDLSLVSEAIGYRELRTVRVAAGRTADVDVTLPKGSIDVNATPWAEVFIDGEKVGETPLAGVPVSAGRHSVKFRHPTLGERTLECLVTIRQPARVSTDLRK